MVKHTAIQRQAIERVKALKAEGFSRMEIARRFGTKQATVYNWYSGRTGISKKYAEKIMSSEVQSMKHEMLLPRDYGAEWIQPANWRERSKLGSYWNAFLMLSIVIFYWSISNTFLMLVRGIVIFYWDCP